MEEGECVSICFDGADGRRDVWFGMDHAPVTHYLATVSMLAHVPRGDLCAHVETFHASVGAEAGTLRIEVVGVQVADLFSWRNWKPVGRRFSKILMFFCVIKNHVIFCWCDLCVTP